MRPPRDSAGLQQRRLGAEPLPRPPEALHRVGAHRPLDRWREPGTRLEEGQTGAQAGGDVEGRGLPADLRRGQAPAGANQGPEPSQLSGAAGACPATEAAITTTGDATATGDARQQTTGRAAGLHLDAAGRLDATIENETDVPRTTTETTAVGRDRTKEARAATKEAKLARVAMVGSRNDRLPKARAKAIRAATGATSGTMGAQQEGGAVPRIVDDGLELRWRHGRS